MQKNPGIAMPQDYKNPRRVGRLGHVKLHFVSHSVSTGFHIHN